VSLHGKNRLGKKKCKRVMLWEDFGTP
jgi:hypothetical protein